MSAPNDDAEARFRAAVAEVRALREADEAHDAALPERTPADPRLTVRALARAWKRQAKMYAHKYEWCSERQSEVARQELEARAAERSMRYLLGTRDEEIDSLRALAASQRETITTLTRIRKELQDLVLEHAAKCEAARAALSRAEADRDEARAMVRRGHHRDCICVVCEADRDALAKEARR